MDNLSNLWLKLESLELQARQLKILLDHYKNPPQRLPLNATELDLWWAKETKPENNYAQKMSKVRLRHPAKINTRK